MKQLSKRFGTTLAVDGIDLRIEAGELFFLLGPSGCGKSTLLRMIAGLIAPSSGSLHFGDRDVSSISPRHRNTAMVFQSYALWPHMTVEQNVAFGLDVRRVSDVEKKRRVNETLAITRISELAQRRPAQLSGGQQQRVALARALVVRPDVLLLDEPLSNLDAKLRLEMRTEIRRLCHQTQTTAVYVTHDQEEALSIADRIAVMHDGRLCQVGTPSELYRAPRTRFVAAFLGQANFLSGIAQKQDGKVLLIETNVGLLRSISAQPIHLGQRVTCCVRPESSRLLANGAVDENVIGGTHEETIYLGHAAQHVIRLPDGSSWRLNEPSPRGSLVIGSDARFGFSAAEVIVVQD